MTGVETCALPICRVVRCHAGLTMSLVLNFFIQAGWDVIATKSYSVATLAILFYDHLLTLADEVKYAWSGSKSWTFWLFLFNRYFPMTYQFWLLATSFGSYSNTKLCDKTSWYPLFMFTICTLLAQVVLTLRVYAVTMGNIPIVCGFSVITVAQLAIGIWMTVLAALKGAEVIPVIPEDAYHLCIFIRHRTLEIAFTSVSLFYDFLTFFVIIFLAARSGRGTAGLKFKIPGILRNIAEDATRYFLVIFTSHFVLLLVMVFARETIQLLPAPGTVVYLPVMISRLMLSLKKAADPQRGTWSFGGPPTSSTNIGAMSFARPQSGGNANGTEGDIHLETQLESQLAGER